MSRRPQKRKQRERDNHPRSFTNIVQDAEPHEPDPALYIQAYEADIVRGPAAWESAPRLEVGKVGLGTALIRLDAGSREGEEDVWVDRYALVLRSRVEWDVSYSKSQYRCILLNNTYSGP